MEYIDWIASDKLVYCDEMGVSNNTTMLYGWIQPFVPSSQNATLSFKNVNNTQWIPIVVYIDLESVLIPIYGEDGNPDGPWTHEKHHHIAGSVGVMVKSSLPNFQKDIFIYTGEDAPKKFMIYMEGLAREVEQLYITNIPMKPL